MMLTVVPVAAALAWTRFRPTAFSLLPSRSLSSMLPSVAVASSELAAISRPVMPLPATISSLSATRSTLSSVNVSAIVPLARSSMSPEELRPTGVLVLVVTTLPCASRAYRSPSAPDSRYTPADA